MNFVIISTRAARRAKQHLHVATLPVALSVLGVTKKKVSYHSHNSYKGRLDDLYDLLEEARNNHRQLIKECHPDVGGCFEKTAAINVAWSRVKELVKRKGVTAFLFAFLFYGCAANQPTIPDAGPPMPNSVIKTFQNKSGISVLPVPGQPQYILAPQFVMSPPLKTIHLMWEASTDTNVVGYQILSSQNLAAPLSCWIPAGTVVTNEAFPLIRFRQEFFCVVSINRDGLNSLGFYVRLP